MHPGQIVIKHFSRVLMPDLQRKAAKMHLLICSRQAHDTCAVSAMFLSLPSVFSVELKIDCSPDSPLMQLAHHELDHVTTDSAMTIPAPFYLFLPIARLQQLQPFEH